MGVLENLIILGLGFGASYAAYLYDGRRASDIKKRIEDMKVHTNSLVLERNFTSGEEAEKYVESARKYYVEITQNYSR